MTTTIDEANAAVRQAVEHRLEAQANGAPQSEWYEAMRAKGGPTAQDVIDRFGVTESLPESERAEVPQSRKFYGGAVESAQVHPTSRRFFELCDALKEMHKSKSRDYGCPTGADPLANIRNGARFVGIPSWRAAMVRLSDKVTRLATYNATGSLSNESVADNLLDLASYALLALVLHQEENDGA